MNYISFSIGQKDEDNLSNHDIVYCTGKHKTSFRSKATIYRFKKNIKMEIYDKNT